MGDDSPPSSDFSAPPASPGWLDRLRGRFVVFDGPDGSGKTTQFHRFAQYVAEQGVTVCKVREPGGTAIGEQLRTVLLDPQHEAMDLRCEMLLYMASRAQLVAERIAPAIERREFVLADRFISSTLAYQGTAGGLNVRDIQRVGAIAVGESQPDVVVVFDVDEQTAARRMMGGPKRRKHYEVDEPSLFSDRLEVRGQAFQKAVREGYLAQAADDPQRYRVIDAGGDEEAVFGRLIDVLESVFAAGE